MRDYFFLFYLVNFTRQKLKAGSIHNSVNQLLWAIGFSRAFFISADTRSSIGRYSIKHNSIYRSMLDRCINRYIDRYLPIHSVKYRRSIGEVSVIRQVYRPTGVAVDISVESVFLQVCLNTFGSIKLGEEILP